MNNIENKIKQLKSLYSSALAELNSIVESNFEEKLDSAKNFVISANSVKEDLLLNYDSKILEKYEKSLQELTKQIQLSYDNIVKEKKKVLLEVASELKNLQNKKKIAVYGRSI